MADDRAYLNGKLVMDSKQDLVNEVERLRAVLESLTKDPPATFAREPDEDWEVITKMRAIARAALDAPTGGQAP